MYNKYYGIHVHHEWIPFVTNNITSWINPGSILKATVYCHKISLKNLKVFQYFFNIIWKVMNDTGEPGCNTPTLMLTDSFGSLTCPVSSTNTRDQSFKVSSKRPLYNAKWCEEATSTIFFAFGIECQSLRDSVFILVHKVYKHVKQYIHCIKTSVVCLSVMKITNIQHQCQLITVLLMPKS